MPNQAAYLAAAFNNAADSYNGQFAVFDSKPSYVPHISKESKNITIYSSLPTCGHVNHHPIQ